MKIYTYSSSIRTVLYIHAMFLNPNIFLSFLTGHIVVNYNYYKNKIMIFILKIV